MHLPRAVEQRVHEGRKASVWRLHLRIRVRLAVQTERNREWDKSCSFAMPLPPSTARSFDISSCPGTVTDIMVEVKAMAKLAFAAVSSASCILDFTAV